MLPRKLVLMVFVACVGVVFAEAASATPDVLVFWAAFLGALLTMIDLWWEFLADVLGDRDE